jgi:hypothetical protein
MICQLEQVDSRKLYWRLAAMTKQLTDKQKALIRDATVQAKECIELIAQINQTIDRIRKSGQ